MHKWIIAGVLVAGSFLVVKKTSFLSYAGTLWSQAATEAKNQIPTRFEIERARHEIAQLDKDITALVRPLAEHKADVVRLDREIGQLQTNLDSRREKLLAMTSRQENDANLVHTAPREASRSQLDRDFEGFKRLQKQAEALRKMREAKQTAFDGAQAQLAKLVERKRDFEVRLGQLEADEETIRVASVGSKIVVDDNRASAIEAALREIERRHEVSRAELEIANSDLVSEPAPASATPSASLSEMRAYLERK